jgi:hypothetical protein
MDWKKYENEIFEHFVEEYPSAKIVLDAKVMGRYSKVERQVDILIDDAIAGFKIRIAIDAKHRGRSIDVVDIESFIGFCSDISAQKGLLISLNGFTPAAVNRAHFDESDIELDVLNFSDLKSFQAFGALPYSDNNGVCLPAPFGWIIDGTRREGAVATLYQRGYDLDKAQQSNEWMYVNFWAKSAEVTNIPELIAHQEVYLRADFPSAKINYEDGPQRESGKTIIRCFIDKSYPVPEYTGFVEFKDFIFFCVMFSPVELSNRNKRKLEAILRRVIPIKVKQSSS